MPRDGSGIYHRPVGTDAVTDTTIESTKYNGNVADVEQDLNLPRPIVAGGTGASSAASALANLGGEQAAQVVTNFDSMVWNAGSFYAATSATGSPVSGHAFAGMAYKNDASNWVVEARDITDSLHKVYYRVQSGGTWGAWTIDGAASADIAMDAAAVRYDKAQTLTAPQQAQACTNANAVNKVGDTMTGSLQINAAAPALNLNKTAGGQNNQLAGLTNGNARWVMSLGDVSAEGGSNAGSNFSLTRYNDAGTLIDAPFSINRASGGATLQALTLTKDLTITPAAVGSWAQINLNRAAGQGAQIVGQTNSLARWTISPGNTDAETGSNAGSNFSVGRFNDAGGYIDSPLLINRASAQATFSGNLYTSAGNLTLGSGSTGAIYFGSSGAKVLSYDGTNFNAAGGGFYCSGAIQSQAGRIIASTSDNASVSAYSTSRGTNMGFWNSDKMWFGSLDGAGNPNAGYMSLAPTSNGVLSVGGHYFTGDGNGVNVQSYGTAAGPVYLCVLSTGNPNWNPITHQTVHYPGVWAGMRFDVNGMSFDFRNTGDAVKGGGGLSWVISSDARIKEVTGKYTSGLDAIAALNPVRFTYKGNETTVAPSHFSDATVKKPEGFEEIEKTVLAAPYANSPNLISAKNRTEYIGLVAQEAEITMPELIRQEKGYIDGKAVDDLRSADYTALFFAMINAVKELKARVEELEAHM